MTLRLTVLLGPRETVEAAERLLPVMPLTLCTAYALPGWDAVLLKEALNAAYEAFSASIQAGAHLSDPEPDDEADEADVSPLGPPAPPEPVVHASAALFSTPGTLLDDILYELDPEAYERVLACVAQARRIVELVERRAA